MARVPSVVAHAGLVVSASLLFGACTTLAGISGYDEVPCVGSGCGDARKDDDVVDADTGDGDTSAPPDISTDSVASDGEASLDGDADSSGDVSDTGDTGDAAPVPCSKTPAALVSMGAYSIDRTEVTNAQYAEFLKSVSGTGGQPAFCSWNTSYVPAASWPAAVSKCDDPVANVDWCDAAAYCKWATKRLCGHPAGGAVPFSGAGFTISASDQWFQACSSNGANEYTYAGVYVSGFCVDKLYGVAFVVPVASAKKCHGTLAPYDAVFDLNGNVAEWEDSCDKSVDAGDDCRLRGGSYLEDATKTTCAVSAQQKRAVTAPNIGFRCCSL